MSTDNIDPTPFERALQNFLFARDRLNTQPQEA